MKPKIQGIGGYASVTEDEKNMHVRGQYGHSATIPLDNVEEVLKVYNIHRQAQHEHEIDEYSLAQITGSSGPSTDFVLFYNNMQKVFCSE